MDSLSHDLRYQLWVLVVLLCIEFARWIHIHQCVWLDVADPMESDCLTSDHFATKSESRQKKQFACCKTEMETARLPLDNNHQLMKYFGEATLAEAAASVVRADLGRLWRETNVWSCPPKVHLLHTDEKLWPAVSGKALLILDAMSMNSDLTTLRC